MHKCQETEGAVSSGEWINRPVFTHEREHYSAIKKEKNPTDTCKKLCGSQNIIPSERNYSQKITHGMIPWMSHL